METIFQKALSLHVSGKSQREIATELGVSQSMAFRLIRAGKGDPTFTEERCPCCGRSLKMNRGRGKTGPRNKVQQ